MTKRKLFRSLPLLLFPLMFLVLEPQSIFASTIKGTVYDNRRNHLADVDVELLDELSRPRKRTKTDGSGKYEFSGLGDGRYSVKVMPFRYNLTGEEQMVEIVSVSYIPDREGTVIIIQDFYLNPKKNSFAEVEASVVFAQEVPNEAKAAYENAVNALAREKLSEGLAGLRDAIRIFPDYFLALQRLGKEYFLRGQFSEAVPLLTRAVDINNKSPMSFFLLGYALHKLGFNKAAVVALDRAAVLNPASPSIFLALGTSERLEGQFENAERHLRQAKKLSKTPLPDLHWQLALLYGENLKRYAEAADELEAFLKARPKAQDAEKIRKIIKSYREKAKQK